MTADDIQQTLTDLTSPTITLIEKFCDMPSEVKSFFGGMLAVYENDPRPQNAEKINNIIKSRMDREEKKTWLKNELSNVSPEVIAAVREKYIKNKEAVPYGLPRSGELLTFLDYIPRQTKDQLMEAQAAARILRHLDGKNCNLKATIIKTEPDKSVVEQKDFLNKPFATTIQRAEQIADFLCAYKNNENDMLSGQKDLPFVPNAAAALAECKKLAVNTLAQTADYLKAFYPNSARRISDLCEAYKMPQQNTAVNLPLIVRTADEAAAISVMYFGDETENGQAAQTQQRFSEEEGKTFRDIVQKRGKQIQNALSYFNEANKKKQSERQ